MKTKKDEGFGTFIDLLTKLSESMVVVDGKVVSVKTGSEQALWQWIESMVAKERREARIDELNKMAKTKYNVLEGKWASVESYILNRLKELEGSKDD